MPKQAPQRRIDSRAAVRSTSISGITLSAPAPTAVPIGAAGSGLIWDGGVLSVGAGLGITVNADDVALTTPGTLSASTGNSASGSHTHSIDSTIARSAITLTAGAGLTGGGDLTANRTFNIGAGLGITVNADDVALTTPGTLSASTGNSASGSHTHSIDSTIARSAVTLTAGAGLTGGGDLTANRTFDIGAGTLIAVGANDVSLAAGTAQYQVPVTGASPFAPAYTALSAFAGAGLAFASGTFAIGAGAGLTVNADDVALTTPGTLSASTGNSASGSHTHAITANVAAVNLSVSTTGTVGTSASLARSDHTHAISTLADVTGGNTSILASASGNLKLQSGNIAQAIASNATFASGFAGSGWRVDYGVTETDKSAAEFDNLTVRGSLRVYELLIQQIRATNGSVFVSSSSRARAVTAQSNSLSINGSAATVNNANWNLAISLYQIDTGSAAEDTANRSLYHGFLVGDVIRAQQVNPNASGGFDLVRRSDLQVTSVANLYTYTAVRVSATDATPAAGMDYVRLGSTSNVNRRGSVYLTADDSNAPFIDIVDGVQYHSDWNTAGRIRSRLGRLSGVTDPVWGTLSGYGLWSDNVYLTGSIYATNGTFNGSIYATNGTFNGTVTAGSGNIGGWTIGATSLTGGSATLHSSGYLMLGTGNDVVELDAADATHRLWVGHTTASSAPFRVTKTGALTATSGNIGGWTIGATSLTAGSGNTTVGLDSGGTNPALYAGSATPASAPFRVTAAGALTATSGSIGSWGLLEDALFSNNIALYTGVVGTARLQVGNSNQSSVFIAGVASAGSTSDITFWAGTQPGDKSTAPFRVTAGGALTATSATITGSITASSGSITGALTLGASGGIYQGSGSFASPTTGLKIWNDSGTGRIAGYNSNTLQWGANTSGYLTAGGGSVTMNSSGISIKSSQGGYANVSAYQILNYDGSSVRGGMYGYEGSSNFGQFVRLYCQNSDSPASVEISAETNSTSIAASIALIAAKNTTQARIDIGGTDGGIVMNTYLRIDEITTTPASPANGTQARIYIKNDKLIIQFNDANTIRYKYLDLTGTGVTWTHSTTAP